jgi:Na+/H+-dicarboxylate symporter
MAMTKSEMLQIVVVALIFGLALVALPAETAHPLVELLGSLEAVCMAIVRWVMLIAPFAVFGLIAKVTLATGLDVLLGMGVYVGVVLLGFVALLVFYMAIVAILGRRNPIKFLGQIRDAQLMAFSTNSSAAAMPVSLQVAEEKLEVRPSTARFIIPIGATVNMDASALYQGMATVFIAQVYGIDLPMTSLLVIVVTAVGASIGTPATPGVGIVVLSTVLTSAGVPLEGLTLIIGLDRVLELFRAALNVTGDLVACTVMDRIVPTEISREEELAVEAERQRQREASGAETLVEQPA